MSRRKVAVVAAAMEENIATWPGAHRRVVLGSMLRKWLPNKI